MCRHKSWCGIPAVVADVKAIFTWFTGGDSVDDGFDDGFYGRFCGRFCDGFCTESLDNVSVISYDV